MSYLELCCLDIDIHFKKNICAKNAVAFMILILFFQNLSLKVLNLNFFIRQSLSNWYHHHITIKHSKHNIPVSMYNIL